MSKVIILELTEGQVLAILDAIPGSEYSVAVTLLRKIDKQLQSQVDVKFKKFREHLRTQNSTEFINSVIDLGDFQ